MSFLILLTVSIFSIIITAKRLDRYTRIPFFVYNGFYILTVVIGGIIIGFPAGEQLWIISHLSMDTSFVNKDVGFKYWFLLLSPLFIPNISLLYLSIFRGKFSRKYINYLNIPISKITVFIVVGMLIGYCVLTLFQHGQLGTTMLNAGGDYQDNIISRTNLFGTLGNLFFGIVYMSLPMMANYCLYQMKFDRFWYWLLIIVGISLTLLFFYMSIFTKSNLLIYFISMFVGAIYIGWVKGRHIPFFLVGGVILVGVQEFFLADQDTLDFLLSISNVLFRMASSHPYYVTLFPDVIPFVGIDLGLQRFGIGPDIATNMEVMNYMYPSLTWVQATASAAAHLVAFAEGGYAWSIVTLLFIGAIISFIGYVGRCVRTPILFACYTQLNIMVYYFTQSSVVSSFTVSYGIKWAFFALVLTLFVETILQSAVKGFGNKILTIRIKNHG